MAQKRTKKIQKIVEKKIVDWDNLEYFSGFGNHFETELEKRGIAHQRKYSFESKI